MWFYRCLRPLLLTAGVLSSSASMAQSPEGSNLVEVVRQRMATMSPEEKQQLREQVKAQWQQLPPAEKASAQQKVQSLQSLPPDERQKLRNDLLQILNNSRAPASP